MTDTVQELIIHIWLRAEINSPAQVKVDQKQRQDKEF